MEKGQKLNPQRQKLKQSKGQSPFASRLQLKKAQENVDAARYRVLQLKKQLNKQKQSVIKNKRKVEDIINKKVAINNVNSYKKRDNSVDLQQLEEKRRKNRQMKLEHERSLQNIQKAIYLVKLDDARQIKSIKQEHRRRRRQMQQNFNLNKSIRQQNRIQNSDKSKQRKKQYWRQRLVSIYTNQAIQTQRNNQNKQQRQNQLKRLQNQQYKLMQQMSRIQQKQAQTKKYHLAAISLPARQVAQALGQSKLTDIRQSNSLMQLKKKKSLLTPKNQINNRSMNFRQHQYADIKLPTTNINHQKLAIVLKELKRDDRSVDQRPVDQSLIDQRPDNHKIIFQ